MEDLIKWHNTKLAHAIVDILNAKSYLAYFADDRTAAAKILFSLIPENSVVGLGGSGTLDALGAVDRLREGPYRLIDRYRTGSWAETMQAYRDALSADVFLTGTNAITMNGELVNIDSSGNRVAAMIFGPEKLIIVAGVNKIVDTLDDAFARLRKIAPLNCRRLGHKTPCAETGICSDCQTPERMCNYTGIIHNGMKEKDRIHIIMIAESLGF